ncbi:N-acetylneuraminate synthase [Rhizobium wuzhouense]|uniref:N-acetylneuraminate synthase n=1 Tax=Rhizobium wuzhouense TaxID=1986026 RepID=A0ABX5NVA0_9HYPH|nr:N-acetylneuraminate synthase [Rhizobium wuzhouense]PYB77095.1 N-acetylneuraminate synthase [Rhizobium wuzhouense]
MQDKVFIIAEAGVNHNGNPELLKKLVEIASEAGADAIKFQTFNADRLAMPGADTATYQKRETGEGDQHSMLRKLELSDEMHHLAISHCAKFGIEFMSTPFDEEALEYLCGLGINRVKIPSGEISNLPFLRACAQTALPLILSTGMATLEEVVDAVACVREEWAAAGHRERPGDLTVLHCTSNYPAKTEESNLRAMATIAKTVNTSVGYSDHTEGLTVAVAAVALGASVVEKHFTVDRTLPGPDHKASLEPRELSDMVRQIRIVEGALGDGVKKPNASELAVRDVVRKSASLSRPVAAGETITRENLIFLRPGTGIAPVHAEKILGMKAARDLKPRVLLTWEDLA